MLGSLIIILTVLMDQLSKHFAVSYLKNQSSITLINNFLSLRYVENRGAAWGMLQNQRIFFVVITTIVITGILVYINMNKGISKLMKVSLYLVIGGAIGNLIDRIRMGYVVDFASVTFGKFYDFPVFNFADSFIVIGTIIMIYLVATDKY